MDIYQLIEEHGDILNDLYLKRFRCFGDQYLGCIDEFNEYLKKHGLSDQDVVMIRNRREFNILSSYTAVLFNVSTRISNSS